MSDEFDDAYDQESLRHSVMPSRIDQVTRRSRVARLVSRAYGAASAPLRATMLACLVRPLGALGLVAVASGAFAGLLRRGGARATGPSLDEVGSYSNDQIFQLVRFVEQVSPDAIQQVASLLADSPVGMAAFGAAATMLLVRATRHREPTRDRALPQDIVEKSKDGGESIVLAAASRSLGFGP
jgi:hypothetical protein